MLFRCGFKQESIFNGVTQNITITENIFHFNAVLERNTLRLQKNEVMRRMATRRDRCG
jgi:hypothetical protein